MKLLTISCSGPKTSCCTCCRYQNEVGGQQQHGGQHLPCGQQITIAIDVEKPGGSAEAAKEITGMKLPNH